MMAPRCCAGSTDLVTAKSYRPSTSLETSPHSPSTTTAVPQGHVTQFTAEGPLSVATITGTVGPGVLCQDILAQSGGFFATAICCFANGMPENIDADGNSIPCETLFTEADLQDFYDDTPLYRILNRNAVHGVELST